MSQFKEDGSIAPATPILVIGLNRSGTKWLSNILCNHPAIAGIQSERALGILETNMFHRMQRKFDLRSADDYVGFLELWRRTEFFRLTGESVESFYGLDPRPLSFVVLFDLLMQRHAERVGAIHWLQKCDPERALQLIPQLPNSKVLIIKRDTVAVAESLRQMNLNRGHRFSLLKSIPGLARSEKLLRKVQNIPGAIVISYESLRQDPRSTVDNVCKELKLNFSESLLNVRFQPNTSFKGDRPKPLNPAYKHLLRFIGKSSSMLPLWFLDLILRTRRSDDVPLRFVQGTFGDLKDRLSDRRDYYD